MVIEGTDFATSSWLIAEGALQLRRSRRRDTLRIGIESERANIGDIIGLCRGSYLEGDARRGPPMNLPLIRLPFFNSKESARAATTATPNAR